MRDIIEIEIGIREIPANLYKKAKGCQTFALNYITTTEIEDEFGVDSCYIKFLKPVYSYDFFACKNGYDNHDIEHSYFAEINPKKTKLCQSLPAEAFKVPNKKECVSHFIELIKLTKKDYLPHLQKLYNFQGEPIIDFTFWDLDNTMFLGSSDIIQSLIIDYCTYFD